MKQFEENTNTLRRIESLGDKASEELMPAVYAELRSIASRYMGRERKGHTLQPTDLVHEAYARLIDGTALEFNNRSHFLAVGARAMRRVLVDYSRRRGAAKRQADLVRVTFTEAMLLEESDAIDVLALDEALAKFESLDERAARVVELRFFGGLTIDEAAAALGVSHTTVEDDWSMARAWLGRELSERPQKKDEK